MIKSPKIKSNLRKSSKRNSKKIKRRRDGEKDKDSDNRKKKGLRHRVEALEEQIANIPAGPQGPQGLPGKDGIDGVDGAQGLQGIQGERGPQGLPGNDGTDGINGTNGIDGIDGVDGESGKDSADGVFITSARKGDYNGIRALDINGMNIHLGSNPTLVLGGVTLNVLAIDDFGKQVIAELPSAFNGGTHLLELAHTGGDSQFDFTVTVEISSGNIYTRTERTPRRHTGSAAIVVNCDDTNDIALSGFCILRGTDIRFQTQGVINDPTGIDKHECQISMVDQTIQTEVESRVNSLRIQEKKIVSGHLKVGLLS